MLDTLVVMVWHGNIATVAYDDAARATSGSKKDVDKYDVQPSTILTSSFVGLFDASNVHVRGVRGGGGKESNESCSIFRVILMNLSAAPELIAGGNARIPPCLAEKGSLPRPNPALPSSHVLSLRPPPPFAPPSLCTSSMNIIAHFCAQRCRCRCSDSTLKPSR